MDRDTGGGAGDVADPPHAEAGVLRFVDPDGHEASGTDIQRRIGATNTARGPESLSG